MEPLLGQITQYAFFFPPSSWMECAGQPLSIADNQALFSLLGTRFGGDGTTTFYLPDMRNAALFQDNKMKYYIAVQGIYPSRS